MKRAFKITFKDGYDFIEFGETLEYWQEQYKTAIVKAVTLTVVAGRFLY